MTSLNDNQLDEDIRKVQTLLDELETLICQQTANPDGDFEDLLK